MLRAILRAGGYELMFRKDVPARVVITEYVDVTHGFYGEDEPGLVNAVLDSVAREVRPGELEKKAVGRKGRRSLPAVFAPPGDPPAVLRGPRRIR